MGAIVGGVIGGVIFLVGLVLAGLWLLMRQRRRKRQGKYPLTGNSEASTSLSHDENGVTRSALPTVTSGIDSEEHDASSNRAALFSSSTGMSPSGLPFATAYTGAAEMSDERMGSNPLSSSPSLQHASRPNAEGTAMASLYPASIPWRTQMGPNSFVTSHGAEVENQPVSLGPGRSVDGESGRWVTGTPPPPSYRTGHD